MSRSPMRPILVLTALLLALLPAAALAGPRERIIRDCADDGRLQGNYSQSQIRDARQNLPSDVAEYTDCADVLRRAELPDRGGGAAGGPSGGATGGPTAGAGVAAASGGGGDLDLLVPTSDADLQALRDAAENGRQPVTVGDRELRPELGGAAPETSANGLPASLLVVLVLLAAGAVAALLPAARRAGPWRSWPGRLGLGRLGRS